MQPQFGRNDNVISYIGKVILGSVPKMVIIVSIYNSISKLAIHAVTNPFSLARMGIWACYCNEKIDPPGQIRRSGRSFNYKERSHRRLIAIYGWNGV